jgi:Winged helix domain, variant/ATPase family associated with various cellular activities (AAA)
MVAIAPQRILEELSGLNVLLRARTFIFRRDLTDPYRGLYISDQDADGDLSAVPLLDPPSDYVQALESVRRRWRDNARPAPDDANDALRDLVRAAQLDEFDRGVILLCLAPEIDLRYQRIYAYLHDDVTRKNPSVDLALNLLCATHDERLRGRRALAADGTLRSLGLIEVDHDPESHVPFLAHSLRLTERAIHFLLDGGGAGPALPSFMSRDTRPISDPPLDWLEPRELRMVSDMRNDIAVHLVGERDATLRVARGIAARFRVDLLRVDCRAAVDPTADVAAALRRLRCERVLLPTLVLWDGFEAVAASAAACRDAIVAELERASGVQLIGSTTSLAAALPARKTPLIIAIPRTTAAAREQLWRVALSRVDAADPIDPADLAARYPFEPRAIDEAARLAAAATPGGPVQLADLERACRAVGAASFSGLAQRVESDYEWGDLVLPPDRLAVLHEICTHARLRLQVGERWGFARHGSSVRGISVLFSGPSGTGKTMSAGIAARALGLELYRIDLSRVVSKYIGETEKNLARVFDEARGAATCLLFDEADALFAKRGEVKNAHDRFANLETSYLLQRLEEYDGLVFLSTNLHHNIDSAFLRRLHFIVHFPAPDERQRQELWRRIWPTETPLADDIDFDFLARSFTLTGGHIRNIALTAAIRACAAGRAVAMGDVVHATRREYEKLGRNCSAEEFGPYLLMEQPRHPSERQGR